MNDTLRALAIADIKAWAHALGIPMDDELAGRVLDGLIEIETEQAIHGCVGATDDQGNGPRQAHLAEGPR